VKNIISKYRETFQVFRTVDVSEQLVSYPETSVRNYHYSPHNKLVQRSSHYVARKPEITYSTYLSKYGENFSPVIGSIGSSV
jgi:hypothetical protein